jgi:antitoxin component YwqK of YwqJK toxin-antitoxin module
MAINKILFSSALILLLIVKGFSQSNTNDIRHFSIVEGDSVVKSSFITKPTKNKLNELFTYYWYYDGKINHNQGGYSGKLLQGTYEVFDNAGKLIEKGQFKNGLQTNIWTTWYPNGTIKSIVDYKNGFAEGKAKIFDDKRKLIALKHYNKGILQGKSIFYMQDTIIMKKYKDGKEISSRNKPHLRKAAKVEKKKVEPNDIMNKDKTKPHSFFNRTFSNIKRCFTPKKKKGNEDKPKPNNKE